MKPTLIPVLTLLLTSQAFAQQGQAPAGQPNLDQFRAAAGLNRQEMDARSTTAVMNLIRRLSREMNKEFIVVTQLGGLAMTTLGDDADYDSLLAILRASGYVAIDIDDQVLITSEANMRSLPSRVLNEDDRRVSDNEVVTRVITLPDATEDGSGPMAQQLVPILRPMMPQNAQLGAPASANKLIIVDRYDNVRRITEVIEALVDD